LSAVETLLNVAFKFVPTVSSRVSSFAVDRPRRRDHRMRRRDFVTLAAKTSALPCSACPSRRGNRMGDTKIA
jgi:hypothetical protein